MLSKAKGQILRVAASLSLLFSVQEEDEHSIPDPTVTHISEDVIKAAINFVDVCCQHTSFMAGRGVITEEISTLIAGMFFPYH